VELVDFSATVYELTGIDPDYDHFGKSLLPLLAGDVDEHRDAAFCEGGRLLGETQAMERQSNSQGSDSDKEFGLYYPRLRVQISDDLGVQHTKATMCRTKTHKYIRRHYEQDELYDLEKDPTECVNVIDDPSYATVLSELKERMLRWYMETCDVVPRETDNR
jgi:arylsulfatase A-like enzyme